MPLLGALIGRGYGCAHPHTPHPTPQRSGGYYRRGFDGVLVQVVGGGGRGVPRGLEPDVVNVRRCLYGSVGDRRVTFHHIGVVW